MRHSTIRLAAAFALLLVAPAFGPGAGASHATERIVIDEPRDGDAIAPDALVRFAVLNVSPSSVVRGNVTIDGREAATFGEPSSRTNTTWHYEVRLTPLDLAAANRTLEVLASVDGRLHAAKVRVFYDAPPAPLPPGVTYAARHGLGVGFYVNGTAPAEANLTRVEVRTSHGSAVLRDPGEEWGVTVRAFPPRGANRVHVTFHFENGTHVVERHEVVDVVGVHAVFYDRTVETRIGAHVDADETFVPPRVRDGTIAFCADDRCHGYRVGTYIRVGYVSGGLPRECSTNGQMYGGCRFDLGPGAYTRMSVLWAQAAPEQAHARIEGWLV